MWLRASRNVVVCLLIWLAWQIPARAQYDGQGTGAKDTAPTLEKRLNALEQKVAKLQAQSGGFSQGLRITDLGLLVTFVAASGGLFVYFNRRLTELKSRVNAASKNSANPVQLQVLDLDKKIAGLSGEIQNLKAQQYQGKEPRKLAGTADLPASNYVPKQYPGQFSADATSPPNITPANTPTQQRTEFYNRVLREVDSNTIRKERIVTEWPTMTPMSMNVELVRLGRDVQLSVSDNDIFYSLADEIGLYEIYIDPGVNVRRIDAVGYAFEIEGPGSFIRGIDRPARFKADGRSARLVMVEKGRLVT